VLSGKHNILSKRLVIDRR